MNKKLVTLAVAAALAAPAAAMADATIYGKLHVSIDYGDVKNARAPTVNPNTGAPRLRGEDFKGWGVNGDGGHMPGSTRANRVGIKGSEDLGGGLKAIYQVELEVNLSASDNQIADGDNGIRMRNSFVGLAGGWGTFLVGRHDTPLKISTGKLDMFADTMADYNGTVGFDDLRADNTIAYISPSFSGFQLAAAVIAPGGATVATKAVDKTNIDADSINEGWSIAGIYKNGPFYASLAYESLGDDLWMDTDASQSNGTCDIAPGAGVYNPDNCRKVTDDFNKWRIGLGLLDWNGFSLTAIYENWDDLPGSGVFTNPLSQGVGGRNVPPVPTAVNTAAGAVFPNRSEKADLWQIQAAYAFGNNTVKGMYGQMNRDGKFRAPAGTPALLSRQFRDYYDGDKQTWAIAFDHNFSKRTRAYVLYTDVSDDRDGLAGNLFDGVDTDSVEGTEWSGFSVGMIHKF